MFASTKFKLISLSTLVLLITALFWLLPVVFPFENSSGDSSSFIPEYLNRFGKRDRTQIGEHEDIDLVIRYSDPKGYKRQIKKDNASFIKVHFGALDLLPGDYVTVSDPLAQQVYTYPGVSDFTTDGGDGFWALTIFDDTAEIELHSRYTEGELYQLDISSYGVSIDRYARGYSMIEIQDYSYLPESVCGSDERLDAVCFQDSHPEEFVKSNAVAMHVYNGLGWCSAWRVGPGNHMFTNEHCLTNQAELNASEFWFGHQRLSCSRGSTQIPTIVTGKTLLEDDYSTDFVLFTVNDPDLIGEFGWLEIDDRLPVLNEEIYIPQQPGGLSPDDQRKVIALNSDMNRENVCRIDDANVDGRWLNTDTSYMCDTSPGASGSPVLARSSHAVLSLHHLGGCRNQGVRMNQIWPMVSEHLTPSPDLISVSVPERVEVGGTFPVRIEAQNINAASPEGIIAVSILYSEDTHNLSVADLNASWADRLRIIEPGQGLVLDKGCQEITGGNLDHFIEAVDMDWESGERHALTFNITPRQEGTLWLRVRNTMKDLRAGCSYHNSASLSSGLGVSETDQSGWDVVRFAIEVEPNTQLNPLEISGLVIDDDNSGSSVGNNDGIVNCGETIELGVGLHNYGNSETYGISADITSGDSNITLAKNLADYPDIPAGASRSAVAVLDVSPGTPDGYAAYLGLEITASNAGSWKDSIEINVDCDGKIPPITPQNPYPAHGSKDVPINSILSWNMAGAYTRDQLSFDVYLNEEESAHKSLICVDSPVSVCDPGNLKINTRYSWYVTATDNSGVSFRGGPWDFQTGELYEPPDLYLPFVSSNQ